MGVNIDLNGAGSRALVQNVGGAVAACGLLYLVIIVLGWDLDLATDLPPGLPSGVWLILFGMMGIARFLLNREAAEGWLCDHRRAPAAWKARWQVDLLMANCLLYAAYTLGLSSDAIGLFGNGITITLAALATASAWPASRSAALLIAPVVPWVGYATTLILGAV